MDLFTSYDFTTLAVGAVKVSLSATGPVTSPWMTSTRANLGTNPAQLGPPARATSTVSVTLVPFLTCSAPPSVAHRPPPETRTSRPLRSWPWSTQTRPARMPSMTAA